MDTTGGSMVHSGWAVATAHTAHQAALEKILWDTVSWTFKVTPSRDGTKEGRIIAEWSPGKRLERIFNTRDARKMTMFEWIGHNQQEMIKDILTRLEAQYGSTIRTSPETNSSTPRLPS